MKPFRLAIAGIHIEASTFSPQRTRQEDFLATRGAEMLPRYPFLMEPAFAAVSPVPLAHFRAIPGGQVRRDCYETMKREILDRLETAGPVDAFFFDVHGAMTVEGLEDAEADLLASIREKTGSSMPITCSQDLHGNVSDALIGNVDFITTYRTAPHVDWMETRERAVSLLLKWWRNPQPVFRARVGIPVLVSGEMSSTESEPGMSLYAPLPAESDLPGVWDASLWVGYAWADQARSMATAVVTGHDADAVKTTAGAIARRYWEARGDFHFVAPAGPAEWCIEEALKQNRSAVFLSDAGDNPTAGAAGDVPATLSALVAHPAFHNGATAIFASMPDADAVSICAGAGTGDLLNLTLGGKLDPIHGKPLEVTARLVSMTEGDPVAGRQAVVRCGGIHIILTELRKPFHKRQDFLTMGLDPLEHTITIVKIGYLEPELKAMAAGHLLVLSPGAVQPLLTSIDYKNLKRPIYPLDRDFEWQPDARVFRSEPVTGEN
ncbi:M81 family metallopeptidase [Luteolibacter yonseiensis]|uniref:M81 family metallopeptidase n=1 Tax=Luteolibacter yonseiensis TaxID=1144680 RepID=A0A934QXA4_9BACT|nr:M81 family metallopeptidase [Luteolibacter yonseiensis]MBK1814428.1 M81 family metallopeptidase [Luteolibacter yonseiensis]